MIRLLLFLVLLMGSGCATEIKREGDFMTTYCFGVCLVTTSKGGTTHKTAPDD